MHKPCIVFLTFILPLSLGAEVKSPEGESRATETQFIQEKDRLNFLETLKNNDAATDIENKKPEMGLKNVSELLIDNPENALLHYNLGVSLLHLKDVDKAKQEFEAVYKTSQNPEMKFYAAFNLGFIYGLEKKIDKAIEMYQKALDIHPDSVEAKVNIELLLQNQSGGGGGEDGEPQQDQSESGEDEQDQPQKYQDNQNKKPQEFKSKELTRQDVKDILEELEQQEQKIRDKLNQKKSKEKELEKDW